MTSTLSLNALYYPYARCTNENTLKRAILIFDKILFIDPTTQKMRDGLITDEQEIPASIIEDWKSVHDSYDLLLDKKIVELYDPENFIVDNDKLLANALKADLNDNEVWRLCTSPGMPNTWSILRRKVPSSAFEFLNSQVLFRINYGTARAKAVFHKEFMEWPYLRSEISENVADPFNFPNMGQYNKEEWYRYLFHDGKVAREMDSWYYSNKTERKKFLDVEFSCVFPFTHGSSLVVNQALLVSDKLGLIPFTDSTIHHKLLHVKFQRVIREMESLKMPIISGIHPFHPEKLRRVALTLFDTIIPEQLLAQITIKNAVKYRDKSMESFARLKEYIGMLSSQIESEVWDDKFEKEIQKIVHQKIVPEARKAEESSVEVFEKLFGKLGKKAVKAVAALTPTISASIFAGLSFPLMLLVGSASVAGAVLPDLIESYLEEKKVRRNSLAYLLELKDKGQKNA